MEWEELTITAKTNQSTLVNGVRTTIKKKLILNDISGSIKHGRFTAILGPSGKTFFSSNVTLFRMWKNDSTQLSCWKNE